MSIRGYCENCLDIHLECCGDVERYLSKRNRWIALSGEEVEDEEEVKVKEMYEQGEDAN